MSQPLDYDEQASRRLEAMYVTSDVTAQRAAVIGALGLGPGERVLDVGSGPGFLLDEIAAKVGPDGTVHGVDISESMVEMARSRCAKHSSVTIDVGDAQALSCADMAFDVVVSTQVLEYVSDPDAVLYQMYRVLRPGGRIGVLATDWDSIVWHSLDVTLMEKVLHSWSEHCSDPHLPRVLGPKMSDAGFEVTRREIIPILNPVSDAATYSGGLIDLILGFVGSRPELRPEELDAWATGLRELGNRRAYFFSLNRYLFVGRRPG